MQIAASSVDDYLSRVPAEHRPALTRVRDVMRQSLPAGYEEGILYGMISWYVPPERLAATYNGQPLMIASLASQKNYMALYLLNVSGNPEVEGWFSDAFAAAGKTLDMGKSCVRFRKLEDLPLDVIAKVAARTPVDARIASYLDTQGDRKQKPVVLPGRAAAKPGAKASTKPTVAKAATTKATKTKPSTSKTRAAKPSPAKANKAKVGVKAAGAKPAAKASKAKARKTKTSKTKPSAAKAGAAKPSKAKPGAAKPSKAKPARSSRANAGSPRR